MMMRSWIRNAFTRPVNRTVRKTPRRVRPALEALEDRTVPSAFTVNSIADDGSVGTLRWAVGQANTTAGADTITFSSLFNSAQTITLTSGQLTLTDTATTTISGPGAGLLSVSGNNAGRVVAINSGASAALSGLTITRGNVASGNGGGLSNSGTLTMTDCTVSGNTAGSIGRGNGGGGVYNSTSGVLTLNNTTVSGNSAPGYFGSGGGVFNRGTAMLTSCTVSGNTCGFAGGVGGGIAGGGVLGGGSTTLTGCTISGNAANYGGGIIANFSGLTLMNSTVSGNMGRSGVGGGISVAGIGASLSGSTISANIGGGVSEYVGSLSLTNCTVSGNTGVGVYLRFGAASLTNCTVSGNAAATTGGGIHKTATYGSTLTLGNTIVSGNTAATGPDIDGTINFDLGHNLLGTALSGTTFGPGDVFSDTPLLAPLGNYGGPTQTLALLPGSLAIDAGTGTGAPGTDQRGFGRVGTVDIGAFESQGTALVVNTTAGGVGSDPGQLSLRQAVNLANALPTADTITFDPAVFATLQTITLTTGQLTLTDTATTTISGPGAGLLSVSGNNAGRVVAINSGASAALSGLTITRGNVASGNGGGLSNSGTLTMTDCTVSGNTAGSIGRGNGGGGVYNSTSGVLTLNNTTVSGNSAPGYFGSGGGVFNRGTAMLTSCTVSGNTCGFAGGVGGGIAGGGVLGGGSTTLTGCTISGNAANYGGGIIANFSGLTLMNSTVSGNMGRSGVGGGISVAGIGASLSGSTISANIGGGVSEYVGSLSLTNCTVSGNTGVGVYLRFGAASLTNCTVSGNAAATTGGGIHKTATYGSTLTLGNTIVSGNTAATGPDIDGTINFDLGHNLLGTALSGTTFGPGDVFSDTPLLAPLGNYGGPTQTLALLPGSLAIDAGTGTGAPGTDQRGFGRVGTVDIGAFESSGFTIAVTSGSPQTTSVSTAFAAPLVVTVTANNPIEPVAGGLVTFTAPSSGASATLSGNPATISATGTASVTATANGIAGSYTVSATASGITTPASFSLLVGNASSLAANFNGTPIAAGNYLWFSSVLNASGLSSTAATTIWFVNQTITIGSQVVPVPNASITYHPGTGTSTTVFTSGGWWQTDVYLGSGLSGNQFLSGLGYYLPSGLAGGTKNVTWSGVLFTDQPGVSLNWQWAAAVYTHLPYLGSQLSSVDYNAMKIKPVDDTKSSAYQNSDHAGTPEGQLASGSTIKSQVTGGATGGGGANVTGSYSGTRSAKPTSALDEFFIQLGWRVS